jgi:hypothetical protein
MLSERKRQLMSHFCAAWSIPTESRTPSPGGAIYFSQWRQPLVQRLKSGSPGGAVYPCIGRSLRGWPQEISTAARGLCRPSGALRSVRRSQGLAPLAKLCRRSAATSFDADVDQILYPFRPCLLSRIRRPLRTPGGTGRHPGSIATAESAAAGHSSV